MLDLCIIKVAVRSPVWRDFDYLIPDFLQNTGLQPGQRVIVPFGKRHVVGIILRIPSSTLIEKDKLKFVIDVLDERPIMDESIIKLSEWASDYYHYPLGEVLFGILPKRLRELRSCAFPSIGLSEVFPKKECHVNLSEKQNVAIHTINSMKGFEVVLLHGVTGSGKTEVYLRVIDACLQNNQQALVLVPEISLTPQTLQRFRDRFDVPIGVIHSGIKDSERLKTWQRGLSGEAAIIIGTRSAIFTPMRSLGVIIIDEEHDGSFKQQSGFRYSARDVAIVRAQQQKIPIVLGSATPSIETLHNAWQGRYHCISLPERVGNAKPPVVKIIDIRNERLVAGLSAVLLQTIAKHLQEGGQVLLFLNRRGYAPVLMCHHCAYVERCSRCDAYLTYHQSTQALQCHHCDYVKPYPNQCPKCRQSNLMPVGMGTERLEEELVKLYKSENVIRIDRDVTRTKGSLENLLTDFRDEKAKILIGTQMLAKGHHFPNLTLVAVIDADNGLFSIDFRAQERLAQLLVQVAGRAGREDKVGEVLIQTHCPDHPLLQCLLGEGYNAFAKRLLEERQQAQLPPFMHMALFRAEDKNEARSLEFLTQLKKALNIDKSQQIDLLGPIVAPMARRAGKYRAQLLVQSVHRPVLQALLKKQLADTWLKRQKQKIQWSLDVDPVEFL